MSFNFYKFLISGVFCLMKVIFVILAFSGGFLGGSDSKESACNVEDLGLIHASGRSTGEGNGNPIQYSCLENAMEEESGGPQFMRLQSQTRLSDFHFMFSGVSGFGSG